MRFGYGEIEESEMTYTLLNGQATFRGKKITWHPQGRQNGSSHLHTPTYARLHRVSYDISLRKDVALGYPDGKCAPVIPKGCTRICGEARSLKILKSGTLILNLGSQMFWKIRHEYYAGDEPNIIGIWQTKVE